LHLVNHARNDVIRPSEHSSGLRDLRNNLGIGCGDRAVALGHRIKDRIYRRTNLFRVLGVEISLRHCQSSCTLKAKQYAERINRPKPTVTECSFRAPSW
jgi:hypothetical protein